MESKKGFQCFPARCFLFVNKNTFYAWFTISAQPFPDYACAEHIQNGFWEYDSVHAHDYFFCEPPAMLVFSKSQVYIYKKKQALVEKHKSSHKTGEMPMAALRDQQDLASLLFLMCSAYTTMSHHTYPGTLHTLSLSFALWVWPVHPTFSV